MVVVYAVSMGTGVAAVGDSRLVLEMGGESGVLL